MVHPIGSIPRILLVIVVGILYPFGGIQQRAPASFSRTDIAERLARVRQHLSSLGLDALIVPRADEYLGEYIPERNGRFGIKSWIRCYLKCKIGRYTQNKKNEYGFQRAIQFQDGLHFRGNRLGSRPG